MKSEVKVTPVKNELPFPKLMACKDGQINLFIEENRGVVVYKGGSISWSVGYFSEDWKMNSFTDFHGTVTLSNDDETTD
jgi:hypothetical protein